MPHLLEQPVVTCVVAFLLFYAAGQVGLFLRGRTSLTAEEGAHNDFSTLLGATLTLLGLVVGFSFSMAISHYDQRKVLEVREANTIGTEFTRAELLPATEAVSTQQLLRKYLEQRVAFYQSPNRQQGVQARAAAAALETQLWTAVRSSAVAQPNSIMALVASGMNDLSSAQADATAAWRDRIPGPAWLFMAWLAIFANGLVGFGMQSRRPRSYFLIILPLVVAGAFLFIADIDSARGGLISVRPDNLIELSNSLQTPVARSGIPR